MKALNSNGINFIKKIILNLIRVKRITPWGGFVLVFFLFYASVIDIGIN